MCDFTHIEYIPFSTNISGDYSFRLVITDSLQNAQMAGPEGLHAKAKEVDMSCLVHILAVLMMTENVEYITIATETTHANLYSAQLIEGGSTSAGEIYTDAGLNGSGVVVGIADTGLDVHSCYFSGQSGETAVSISSSSSPFTDLSKRKVVQYVADADDTDGAAGHGTHVVGTLAGHIPTASPSNSPYNGIATGAKVAMFDCAKASWNYLRIPSLYDEVFPAAASAGGTLHSNSWINNIYSYDTATVDADRYLYDNPMFLAFFAAGNSGPDAGTISAPSVSKNAVAVGSTGTGPTIDGRFGIDVVTQGRSVQSSRAFGYATESCSTMVKSGTSMATPAAAGAAALITQYFQDSNFWAANCNPHFPNCPDGNDPVIGFTPSGSLVKAVLLHSGRDLGGGYAFPGNEQGFGRIDLSSVLLVKGVSDGFDLFVEDFVLLSMQERSIFVNVTSCDGRSFIKVSIGWMDVPNFIAVNKQLVHDVDLVVYGPVKGHMKWKGNNNSDGDDLNNVEMVYIQDPVCGMYEIVISGSLFLSPSDQRVSLVLTTSAGGFEIID
ncbi:tagC, partial [Symbiodinium microadriaticum]